MEAVPSKRAEVELVKADGPNDDVRGAVCRLGLSACSDARSAI